MNLQGFSKKMKCVQSNFLLFIEDEENLEVNLQSLRQIIDESKICDNKYGIIQFLRLLTKIANNHYRVNNFFEKIETILKNYIDNIKKNQFSNSEIFDIFKSNKRILLFLFKENIIFFDEYVIKSMTRRKYIAANYIQYFSPEIKPFINESWFQKIHQSSDLIKEICKELPNNFEDYRKCGENEDYICELIRKDSIIEFDTYINQTNYPLDASIIHSIYETNNFLIKKQILSKKRPYEYTLIDYAIFYGSLQIIQYLNFNRVQLKPSHWIDVIHSNNPELIHYIEGSIKPEDLSYKQCISESIKCHNKDYTNYFFNFIKIDKFAHFITTKAIKYHNYEFMCIDLIGQSFFTYLCRYDYPYFVYYLLKTTKIIEKSKTIFFFNYFNSIIKFNSLYDVQN